MEAHEIRLRGGWEFLPAGGPCEDTRRLTLPARPDCLPPGRLRLTRRFQRPPRVPGSTVRLRFSDSLGIHSVKLNGQAVGPPSPGMADFELELGPLAPANVLAIEAEPPRDVAEWGAVSLVFAEGLPEGSAADGGPYGGPCP